jgi:hypothetical protein
VILLCGVPSDQPLVAVRQELRKLKVHSILFNQRQFKHNALHFTVNANGLRGQLKLGEEQFALEDIVAVFRRMVRVEALPELEGVPSDSRLRADCHALHHALTEWSEICPARVIHRRSIASSNLSKPFQSQLIRAQGFLIPETLITNEPELVLEFRAQHKAIIYKSMGGTRSTVQVLTDRDLARLDRIRWCPTQFQQ